MFFEGDPVAKPAIAPIMRWARELWMGLQGPLGKDACRFSLPQMRRMSHAATRERVVVEWRSAKGPVAIARLSLHWLQWEWPTPFAFITDLGDRVDLLISPRVQPGLAGSFVDGGLASGSVKLGRAFPFRPLRKAHIASEFLHCTLTFDPRLP